MNAVLGFTLRQMYEPYVHALSAYLCTPLPPWFRVAMALDSWQTGAWERITTEITPSARTGASLEEHL